MVLFRLNANSTTVTRLAANQPAKGDQQQVTVTATGKASNLRVRGTNGRFGISEPATGKALLGLAKQSFMLAVMIIIIIIAIIIIIIVIVIGQ